MIATLRNVSYRYPSAPGWTLSDVSVHVEEGSYVLLAGPSAGGKSTLLRLFNGLVPQFHGGVFRGDVAVAGLDPVRVAARLMAVLAGMVFQEPESQAVTDVVEDELAFGMEQHGVDPAAMRQRVDHLLGTLGLDHLRHRALATLSGGERQRVAIAAALALEPRILLLDEPTSQLDPAGATAVLDAIERLHQQRGLTVLIAEHRLERVLPTCTSVLEVESGRVRAMSPREAAGSLRAVPAVCELGRKLGLDPIPLTVDEARAALEWADPAPPLPSLRVKEERGPRGEGQELLSVDGLTVAYGENIALRDATVSLREGEVIALLGPNGSGKSTLFRALAGLVQPAAGSVRMRGEAAPRTVQARTAIAGLVPQDPAIALYHETVRDEVAEGPRNRRVQPSSIDDWGLAYLADRNPRDVSVGQQQRISLAAMLAHNPPVWLLDEPTRGADANAKRWLANRLRAHADAGGAAIVATHDIESAARFATRVIALDQGEIRYDLPAHQAFGSSGPFPTQVAQLVPGSLIHEEVVA